MGLTWNELIQKAYLSRVGLSAHAFFATPDIWFDKEQEKGEPSKPFFEILVKS